MAFEGDWIIFPLWREENQCCRMGRLSHAPGSPGRSGSRAACLLFTQQWQVSQSLFLWTGIPEQREGVKSVMKMVGLCTPAVGEPAVSKPHATAAGCSQPWPSGPSSTWALLARGAGALMWCLTRQQSPSQPTVTHLSQQIMLRVGRNIPVNRGWSSSGEMPRTRLESSLAESDGVHLASSVWQRVAASPSSACNFLSGSHPHPKGKGGGFGFLLATKNMDKYN